MGTTTGIVAWTTFGALLTVLGFELFSWQYWCLVGIVVVIDVVSRSIGREQGKHDLLFTLFSIQDAGKDMNKVLRDAREE